MIHTGTNLIRKSSAAEIVAHRDRALECIERGLRSIADGVEAFHRAAETQYSLSVLVDRGFWHRAQSKGAIEDCMQDARREIDRAVWRYLRDATGLRNLMDAKALAEFEQQLEKDPPEVTVENLAATFTKLRAESREIFRRGLVETFRALDHKAYKTNSAFRLGRKIIVANALSEYGGWNHYSRAGDHVADLCRIFHILDGKEPPDHRGNLKSTIGEAHWTKRNEVETEYFRCRLFKNGSVHIWLKRADLIEEANRLIAEHFGTTVPDDRNAPKRERNGA